MHQEIDEIATAAKIPLHADTGDPAHPGPSIQREIDELLSKSHSHSIRS